MSDNHERDEMQSAKPEVAPPAARELPEFRSYVADGKTIPDPLEKGDRVRVRLSRTKSPLWTIVKTKYDEDRKQRVYQLETDDGTLHEEWLDKSRLTREN